MDGAGIEDQHHQVDGNTLELDTNQKDMLDFQVNEDSEDRREQPNNRSSTAADNFQDLIAFSSQSSNQPHHDEDFGSPLG